MDFCEEINLDEDRKIWVKLLNSLSEKDKDSIKKILEFFSECEIKPTENFN
jgi:hypothetical protein